MFTCRATRWMRVVALLVLLLSLHTLLGLDLFAHAYALNAREAVEYDAQRRVTRQTDPYGAVTGYAYYSEGAENAIRGALQEETDALGHKTNYEYQVPTGPRYRSFSHMFDAYVNHRLGGDEYVPGYLAGGQSQPKTVTQYLDGQPVTTTIGYEPNIELASAFQPTSFAAPGGASGTMAYDGGTGRMTTVTVSNGGVAGPETSNEYYGNEGTVPSYKCARDSRTASDLIFHELQCWTALGWPTAGDASVLFRASLEGHGGLILG